MSLAAPGGHMTKRSGFTAGAVPAAHLLATMAAALLAAGCGGGGGGVKPPGQLTYSSNPAVYTRGSAIAPNTPSNSGGAVTSYAVSPALPAGLSLDSTTGRISGTPTAMAPAASYTVTATNSADSASASLSITVNDIPPTSLTYSVNPASYPGGSVIAPNVPSSGGGTVVSYAVAPALPAGLSLDASTGAISGTPAAVAAAASYTVTATNSGGITSAGVSITVVRPPAPTILVEPESQLVDVGTGGYLAVLASGGGALAYQWQMNGVPIAGATADSYATPALVDADSGAAFSVVVSDAFGGRVTSQAATISVSSGVASTGSLGAARSWHTATLLPGGKVLVAGGDGGAGSLASAELYDSVTGAFTATGSMTVPRAYHTATLLRSGKVLIVGGWIFSSVVFASAELYDPAAGTFTATGSLAGRRFVHTATLLPSGKVLIVGGDSGSGLAASAELYDPDANAGAGAFTATGTLATPRDWHTATLLPSGKVLVVGGWTGSSAIASAELYDPEANAGAGAFTSTGALATARYQHTATLLPGGKVLIAGGHDGPGPLASAELWDPAASSGAGAFTATGSLGSARSAQTATLLPGGRVLVAGGSGASALASAELYDPVAGTFTTTGSLAIARYLHTATLLPGGKVLIAGGWTGTSATASAELYDPIGGRFTATGSLTTARSWQTATLLPSGKVLIAGGWRALASAELYDAVTGTFTATGSLGAGRDAHTATLLRSGKVLIVGGYAMPAFLASAELYDPATGTFTTTGSLATARAQQTATLLPSGKVLIVGGYGPFAPLASAELYDPATGTFTTTGSLPIARGQHTATLLPGGTVLIAGGGDQSGALASTELYDPVSGTFTATGSLATARELHTATLLPSGKVLIVGGRDASSIDLANAELYDPAANSGAGAFTTTGGLATAREQHMATLLQSGKVLIAGGQDGSSPIASAEVYDPAASTGAGAFTTTGSLTTVRVGHSVTPLPNGKVLIAGGHDGSSSIASAELYRWW
jgi:hypothetical protein